MPNDVKFDAQQNVYLEFSMFFVCFGPENQTFDLTKKNVFKIQHF